MGLGKGDEAEPPRPPRGRILHDHHLRQLAKDGEVLPDALRRRLPREATDEHLALLEDSPIRRTNSEVSNNNALINFVTLNRGTNHLDFHLEV